MPQVSTWQKLRDYCVSVLINGKVLAFMTSTLASTHYLRVIIDQNLTYGLQRAIYKLYALHHSLYCIVVWTTISSLLSKYWKEYILILVCIVLLLPN